MSSASTRAAPSGEHAPVRTPWRWVALLSATAIASYLCRVNITVAGEPVMREFGISQVAMGRVFSAFVAGYALFMIPAGALADRWGTRRVLLLAAIGWTLVTAAMAVAGAGWLAVIGVVPTLIVLRAVLGVAEAPTFTAAALGISKWVGAARQGRANGFVLAAIGVGSAAAPPLITWLMTHWGWRVALFATALPALAVALVWMRVREPVPTARDRGRATAGSSPDAPAPSRIPPSSWRADLARLKSPSFIALTVSYTLQGYVGYIFVFWFYLYLVQERKFALAQSAWVSSLPWVLTIVSIPLGGWLSDRLVAGRAGPVWGRRIVPIVALTGGGILLAIGASTSNAWLAAIALAVATASVLAVEGPFWATMLSLAGDRAGTAGGIMNMGSNVGGFISPALTPWLAAMIGWERSLQLAGVLGVVAGVLWLWVTPGVAPERPGAVEPTTS